MHTHIYVYAYNELSFSHDKDGNSFVCDIDRFRYYAKLN